MTTAFVVNHVWQSSCFVCFIALLAFALRENSPRVRYWVWLSASLKFLLPWALLMGLGAIIPLPPSVTASHTAPAFQETLVQMAAPFSPVPYRGGPAHAPLPWIAIAIAVWALGIVAIVLLRCRGWFQIRAMVRSATPVELPIPIRAVVAPGRVEPGIVGFLRPVLVLPAGLMEQLNPQEVDAVLAHELCHVRHRDNFFAAVHMVVEAIFWFHPLVWWIGARLVEERELACDEEVLRLGCEPTDYVEGILKVCRFYKESPLPCVSGVTGADVKKRLRRILTGSTSHQLTAGKKAVLAAAGSVALLTPIAIGVLNAPRVEAQATSPSAQRVTPPLVAQATPPQVPRQNSTPAARPLLYSVSLKSVDRTTRWTYPHTTGEQQFEAVSSVHQVIQWAYGVGRDFQVAGGPAWIGAPYFDNSGIRVWPSFDPYEIHATAGRASSEAEMRQMVQALLADRFRLKLHRETRQISVYAIVLGPDGSKLPQPTEPAPCPVPAGECGFPNIGGGIITARGGTMPGFAVLLTNNVDRPVIDKTGITGGYTFKLPYEHSGTDWRTGPAIFPAIQALGLRLEPQTETMEVLAIDSAERPAEN